MRCLHCTIFIALLVLPFAASGQFYGKETYEVSNAQQFVAALGSDRTIQIVTGRIVLSDAMPKKSKHVVWSAGKDGRGLTVFGVKNLRILGPEKTRAEVVTQADTFALAFEKCLNVDLRRLTIRHDRGESKCTSAILGFVSCTNTLLRSLELSGCGTEGLTLNRVARFEARDTVVRDCSIGIMSVQQALNVSFKRCQFLNNGKLYGMDFRNSYDVQFEDCKFEGNRSDNEFIAAALSGKLLVTGGSWTDNKYRQLASSKAAIQIKSVKGLK